MTEHRSKKSPKIVEPKCKFIYRGLSARVSRNSAFRSILGAGNFNFRKGTKSFEAMRSRWVSRLLKLRDAGWNIMDSETRFRYAATCPTVGIASCGPCLRRCGLDRLCPYCWGRKVRQTFRHVDSVCFPLSGQGRPKKSRFDVVTFVCRALISRHTPLFAEAYPVCDNKSPRYSTETDIEALPSLLSETMYRRRDMARVPDSVGGLVWHTLEVESDRKLIYTRKTLALILKGAPLPPVTPAELNDRSCGVRRVFRSPDRKRLAKIVSYFGTYPRLMMTGPAEDTVRILQATRNSRMTSVYGIQRGLD